MIRTRGKIFSVLECTLTGQSSEEVIPCGAGVTGNHRGKASLGAPPLPSVPSVLEINITTGLAAPPEITARPVVITSIPVHDLLLLFIQTSKTVWLTQLQIKELSSQFLQAFGVLTASSWLKIQSLKKCRTPIPPQLLLFPHLHICYCLSSSFFIAQTEMRWPSG